MNRTELTLKILSIPGVGRKSARLILGKIDAKLNSDRDLVEVLFEIRNYLPKVKLDAENIQIGIRITEKILEDSERNNILLLDTNSPNYPELLKLIPDAPLLLSCIGDTTAINRKSVAIVGTRRPSKHAYNVGVRMAEFFAEKGYTVISGLALGCDTAAHIGCLNKNGSTVAVLGHGLHTIYPKENIDLAKRIVDNGGVLLSEYFYGVKPHLSNFIERDRIQAGISQATIVVESGRTGGTLNTVRYSERYNRPVACYSYPSNMVYGEHNAGNKMLIESNRAIPISNRIDLENLIKRMNTKVSSTE